MGYSLIYTPVLHFDDINGRPLVGGKLYTYKAGTSTPAPTYRNSSGTELNENPISLNERGECVCFLRDGSKYKFVLKDSLENTIWEQDNVITIKPNSIGRDLLKNHHNLVPDTNYLQFKDFGGNVVVTLCDSLKTWLEAEGYTP